MKHIIIGTAGHIDHGKTTLIKALTGRDTDTLREEKERGISINLGFTYFDLPSGKRAGIVDVPGHEKFIKNMLAGVSGIDMVLLVIAADEGIMPQTREHLNILSLLDVKKGIVVITKKDMVDDEWLEVITDDISEYLKGSFLENADMVFVSSVNGDGIGELIEKIDKLSEEVTEKTSDDSFRLPIDRVFTISGFGTVITGTLVNGSVSEGDKIEVYPNNIITKVRSIHVHDQPVKEAYAGQRVAINISNVKVEDIKRGDVAAEAGSMESSMMIDCRLNYLKDAEKPLENRDRVRIYHGTNEVFGRVYLLDKEVLEPGETCLAQIRLEIPLPSQRGDKYVIRAYSPMITIGGGTIIDPYPAKHKRFDKKVIAELSTKEKGNPKDIIEQVIFKNSRNFPNMGSIIKLSGSKETEAGGILAELLEEGKILSFNAGEGICYAHTKFINALSAEITVQLNEFHRTNPLKYGMAKEEVKSRIFESNIRQKLFDDVLAYFQDKKLIKANQKYLSLYNHDITLTPLQQEIKAKLEDIYKSAGINVPNFQEATDKTGKDSNTVKKVFELMIDTGELIKINEEMTIASDIYLKAIDCVRNIVKNEGEVTLAQYRDALNTSRKYAVALLEYFDQHKITKRIGDKRVLY
ncbi:selenocysteine-specific elongation factor [Oxobacter pfennigii]|uniref:Selenocysteine-specific elongation factor n=1 Tax=Oxobacter pfennigii TaxID=36849 RepID=A0A0P8W7Z0_9CLOT|nr:selenocysteine-specific translation elongation factor [Oxobacter pfennigii]KPU44145.1 selenocysteine-specific elongation factor [Oxobacter pfennigii]